MAPRIPEIDPDDDVLTAALSYAAAGWYVVPVRRGTKNPGSVLGSSWQHQSSRDPEVLAAWFAGTDHGIALHAGRSGAIVADVDHPDRLPDALAAAVRDHTPPHQSTRHVQPGRGHYLFAVPAGRTLGNGTGKLGGSWGELRGTNGIIVVVPSVHENTDDGGRYAWVSTGPVPVLPEAVAELLHDASGGEDAASDEDVLAFLDTHIGAARPELLDAWVSTFEQKVAEGESRHQRMVSVAAGAMAEARAGYFPARDAMERLEEAFLAAVTHDPVPGGKQGNPRGSGMARSEWMGLSAWAVAQATTADLDEVHARVTEKMPDGNDLSWIPDETPPGVDPNTEEILDEQAGGFEDSPVLTGPAAGRRGSLRTSPEMFFSKHDGLLALELAKAVLAMGPLTTDHGGALYQYASGVWISDGERVIRNRVTELLQNLYRTAYANVVIDMLRSREPTLGDDQLDTTYLNLPNGLLDWRTGQLHSHDPAVPSVIRIPVDWDPDATCPQIEQWIGEVFPDDAREFIEEVIGYSLYNGNPLHKAVLLFGRGRNGKGTLIRLLQALLGRHNFSSESPQMLDENRFRIAELYGKLANLVGDVDPRIFKATETFKKACGEDYLSAERKNGHPFKFVCRALMVCAFNALPRTADTTEGFFSRWIVVPFPGHFPPGIADPGREDKMHDPAELRGLLVLAVRGLRRVMARNGFQLPPSVEKETTAFRRVADPVRAFLDDYVPTLSVEWVPRTEVYNQYHQWCGTTGHSSLSAGGFHERVEASAHDLPEHFVTPRKRQGTRGYMFSPRKPPAGAEGAGQGAGKGQAQTDEAPGHTEEGAEGAGFGRPPLYNPLSSTSPPVRGAGDGPAPHAPQAPDACRCGWGLGAVGCTCQEAS